MHKKYGLFTAISMIIGIVIGSGIFFKSDNILIATGGSVGLGVLLFVLSAFSIIFGSLSISELASRTEGAGGIVSYVKHFYSDKMACGFGWFQTFMYFPALTAVVSWVVGVYMCMLFGLPSNLEIQIGIGIAIVIVYYLFNMLAPKISGYYQISATVIKIIPLLALAVIGLIFGQGEMHIDASSIRAVKTTGFLSAISPIAYAFDGWVVSTSISQEIKNERRNLPLAMIIAPVLILALYIAYFIGITKLVGADTIINTGDEHLYLASKKIFGGIGGKIVIIFIIISVSGTVNGMILGHTRMPYALANNNMLFGAKYLSIVNKRFDMPIYSAIFSFAITLVWIAIHYLTQKFDLMHNSDVSEISVIAQYLMYILLYYKVFDLWRKKEIKSVIKGVLVPIFAIIGAIFIFIGGFGNPLMFALNMLFALVVIILSQIFMSIRNKKALSNENLTEPMFDISELDNIDMAVDNIQSEDTADETSDDTTDKGGD